MTLEKIDPRYFERGYKKISPEKEAYHFGGAPRMRQGSTGRKVKRISHSKKKGKRGGNLSSSRGTEPRIGKRKII